MTGAPAADHRPSVVYALRRVMDYLGGWDAPAGHPCGVGRDALEHADDGTALDFLDVCERRAAQGGADAEYWRRLAGAVRKAATR